jgi:hypothetical protein
MCPFITSSCSSSELSIPNLVIDAGVMTSDASSKENSDAGLNFFDAGSRTSRGIRISDTPAQILHISEDESEIHVLDQENQLFRIASDSNSTSALAQNVRFISGPAATFWLFTDAGDSLANCQLHSYKPGQAQLGEALTSSSAYGLIKINKNSEWALVTDNFQITGQGDTSTRTADLVYIKFDGSKRHTLLTDINLGLWDTQANRFSGDCSPNFIFTSTTNAIAAACLEQSKTRSLIHIDLETLSTSTLSQNVLSFLEKHEDSNHFLWADTDQNVYASDSRGENSVRLQEQERIESIRSLNPKQFAYTTESDQLKIAGFPNMRPSTVQSFGARRIRAVSPDGRFIIFSPSRDTIASLFMVESSTLSTPKLVTLSSDNDSYPGDAPFSPDNNYAFWYAQSDQNYVGKLKTIPTDIETQPTLLADEAYFLRTYANKDKILIMVNAKPNRQNQKVIADLAIRKRDGSDELQVIVPQVQATNFLGFQKTKRVVYTIESGPYMGIWVKELP